MTSAIEKLCGLLDAEQLDKYLFFSPPTPSELPQVYGGQVLSQSLNCATKTVPEDRSMHSMHAYFLRAGDIHSPIAYEVAPIRDGGSYSTRRVVAKQHGKEIFTTTISFSLEESGLEHQLDMPEIEFPQDLPDDFELMEKWRQENSDSKPPRKIDIFGAFETRTVGRSLLEPKKGAEAKHGYWLKTRDRVPEGINHQALLAYVSDMRLIGAAFFPHGINFTEPGLQLASLDHALWIHRPFKVDEWIYYDMESPTSSGGRGLNFGRFYDLSGNLIASSSQEGLMRIRKS